MVSVTDLNSSFDCDRIGWADMIRDLIDEKLGEKSGKKKGETMSKYVGELTALGRASTPEDLQGLLSFLSSKDSDFMTGQTIVCDGGIIFT